jgi:UDP-galactose transporter B1
MWIGYLLMFISISGEALFTDSQAFCKITYKPTINHLMFTVNLMTTLICVIGLVLKGDLIDSLIYCKSHPFVVLDIVLISVLQVLGQVSIYFIVLNFKQHIFPLVSTTRKVFTVLLSIFIFNHKMNGYQWCALILVFGGMGY